LPSLGKALQSKKILGQSILIFSLIFKILKLVISYQDRVYKLSASLIPFYEKLCDIVFVNLYLRQRLKEIQVLNPCLYGPSGVGKTEIATYLAKHFYVDIVQNRIQKLIKDKKLAEELIKTLYPVLKGSSGLESFENFLKSRGIIPQDLRQPENIPVIRLLLQTYPESEVNIRNLAMKQPVILFLDELDKPNPDDASAVLTLLSNRTIRDRILPDNVIIIGEMRNINYEKALFRTLFFIPIKDIPIYVSTFDNKNVVIDEDDEIYQMTQFGKEFKEKFGKIYRMDPIYNLNKSLSELTYLGNLVQALAEFRIIPTPDMIERYNKEVKDEKEKIKLDSLDDDTEMKKLFNFSYEGSKSLKDYLAHIHSEDYKVAVALYKKFVLSQNIKD